MSKTPSPVSSPLPIGYWLPSVTNNQVSALTVTFSSKIIPSNLQTLHKAIEVFIASENSEKKDELWHTSLEPLEISNIPQGIMFTANVQAVKNGMV